MATKTSNDKITNTKLKRCPYCNSRNIAVTHTLTNKRYYKCAGVVCGECVAEIEGGKDND